ncbi:MAG: hypothetical protein ABL860_02290 [Candidatus Nitrotoga sp.]
MKGKIYKRYGGLSLQMPNNDANMVIVAQCEVQLERILPFNKKLERPNIIRAIDWESQVQVNDIAKRRTIVKYANTEADITQPVWVADILINPAPGAAHVVEHRATDPKYSE